MRHEGWADAGRAGDGPRAPRSCSPSASGSLGPAAADPEEDKKKVDAAVAAAGDDLQGGQRRGGEGDPDLRGGPHAAARLRARSWPQAREAATAAEEADRAAQAELEQATAAAIRAEQERAEVEFQIQDLQSRVGNLARAVYQNGAFADFDLLITAQSPTELSDRAQALDAVSRANNQTLAQMAGIRAELALKEARLEVLRQQVDDKRQQAAIALSKANIARDRAAAAKLKVDLLVAQKATALDVARLRAGQGPQAVQVRPGRAAAHRRTAGQAGGRGGGPAGRRRVAELRPHRSWRASAGRSRGSRVGQGVGPRIHPVYGYRSCHTGVDLGAPSGTPIRATAAGIVVINATRRPVRQPHADLPRQRPVLDVRPPVDASAREEGQTVKQGDVIGYVGSTGYSTGPHLHFEIHVGGTPYNPLGWFGAGDKEPVRC